MVEQFFSAIFEHAPSGSFFYGARIVKQIKKAYPKFYDDSALLLADAKAHSESDLADFYFSPAFYFRKTKAIKSNVRGAGVVWVDIDGGDFPDFEQEPNFVIETSPEHFHCYWLLGGMRKPDEIEAINRSLAYQYNTDKSGWDGTQLLRPPGSYNRKRDNFRSRISRHHLDSVADFSSVDVSQDRSVDTGSTGTSGSVAVEQVLARMVLTKRTQDLIFTATDTKSSAGRSGVIFDLACELIGQGNTNADILAILMYADDRLGKYVNHSDRIGTLQGVIASGRAERKTPEPKDVPKRPLFKVYSGNEQLFAEAPDERFLCENLVFENGILMISGEPGSGKSRFVLNLTDRLACGTEFIGFKTGDPILCCYMSLDMHESRVKGIRAQQLKGYSAEEQELINQNVRLVTAPAGLNMNDEDHKAEATAMLLEVGAKFIVVDVVGKAIPDMNKDEQVLPFLNWIQGYISDTGASFGLVTHNRKSQVGNKSTTGLDDWYGSRHWSVTPDTGFAIENQGRGKQSVLHINKDRSGGLGERIVVAKDKDTSLHTLVTSESAPESKTAEDVGGGSIPV